MQQGQSLIESLYQRQVPRYTSYPTALEFRNKDLSQKLHDALRKAQSPLSLYVHIPFCRSLCYYCGCNKTITQNTDKADHYLQAIATEVAQTTSGLLEPSASHLHLGGGSPSFFSLTQHKQLLSILQTHIQWLTDCQMSIELDPRNCDQEYILGLAQLGYKRLSFGVQDTSSEVQTTINRVQCSEHIAMLIKTAYEAGFININVDLIVGLPKQSLSSIAQTLQEVLSWDVERITVFNYAHLPHRFAAQRKFREDQLPASEIRQSMSKYINQHLNSKGYVNIGMDHYAKPTDPLVKAMQKGELQRNFQGYTADNNSNILGFGVSSISTIEDVVAQNPVKLKDYYAALPAQTLHNRGLVLSQDDRVRRQIISELMCNYQCDLQGICDKFAVDMALYFADELATLVNYHHQGLLEFEHGKIRVKQVHRSLIRVIASIFDAYYIPQKGFSKVI